MDHIVGRAVVAPRRHVGEDRPRRAEQHECLVDQVRPEIVEQAAAPFGFLAPARAHERAKAVEMGFVIGDASERAAREQGFYGQEVAIPAAVVERCEQQAAGGRQCRELARLGGAQGHGLVDDDMLAGLERAARVVEMGVVGRRDHDERHLPVGEQVLERVRDPRARPVRACAAGLRGDYDSDACTPATFDQRCVERRAGKSVSDETDSQHGNQKSDF